jgi:hypothetical protein
MGLQVAAFWALLSNAKALRDNPPVFRVAFIFLILLSLVAALAIVRGHDRLHAWAYTTLEVEASNPNEARIFTRMRKHMQFPPALSALACDVFSIACVAIWISGYVWLERRNYKVTISDNASPPSPIIRL